MEIPGEASNDRPPWVRTFFQDLVDVFLALFVYFIGSMIIWPVVLVFSVLFLPISWLWRNLMLGLTVDCICGARYFSCRCRHMLSADEMNWMVFESKYTSVQEFRTHQGTQVRNDGMVNQSSGDRPTQISADLEQLDPLIRPGDELSSYYQTFTLADLARDSLTSNYKLVHTVVMIVEKGLAIRRISQLIDSRIIKLKKPKSKRLYFPRFSQCVVELRGGCKAWVIDNALQLNEHISVLTDILSDQAELQSLLAALNSNGLPISRPLWHLTVVPGYGLAKETVLIWRFHAAMLDGVSIASVLANALSTSKIIPTKQLSHIQLYQSHIAKFFMIGPIRFLAMLFGPKCRRSSANQTKELSDNTKEQFTWTERTLSHSQLLKNKLILQTTVNDMILSLLAGGKQGASISSINALAAINKLLNQSKVLLAMNTWTKTSSNRVLQGNHLQFLPIKLPDRQEMIPRMWNAGYFLTTLKLHGDAYIQDMGIAWIYHLPIPNALYRAILRGLHNGCENILTTLNATSTIATIDRCNVTDVMYFSALPPHIKSSLNFITYSGLIKLSVQSRSADPNLGNTIDILLLSMFRQMMEIDNMAFKRYFPDGLPTGAPNGPQTEIPIDKSNKEYIEKLLCLEEGGTSSTPPRSRPASPFTFNLPSSSNKSSSFTVHPLTGVPIKLATNHTLEDQRKRKSNQKVALNLTNVKPSRLKVKKEVSEPLCNIVTSPDNGSSKYPASSKKTGAATNKLADSVQSNDNASHILTTSIILTEDAIQRA